MKKPRTVWTTLVVAVVMSLSAGCASSDSSGGFFGGKPPQPGVTIAPPKSLTTDEPSVDPSADEPKVYRPTPEPEDIWDNSDDYVEDEGISEAAKALVESALTIDTTKDTKPTAGIERHEPSVPGYFSWEPEWTWGPLEGWDALVKEDAYTVKVIPYDSTDYAVLLEDTPTQAMRAVNIDMELWTKSEESLLVTNVIIFLSLERKKEFGSGEYGPWTVKDAWESVE